MTNPTATGTNDTGTNDTAARIDTTLASIARGHFHKLADRAEPFAARNDDEEDFLETAVWALKAALEEAYSCGFADAEAHHGLQG